MKNHVWRPLFIVLAIIGGILLTRTLLVPSDFGVYERGYMYGWHRKSNEAEWKKFPVKYKTAAVCRECHKDKYNDIKDSPHASISCENCHGPNYDHPKDPIGLKIDRSRGLCIRCHAYLPYKDSARAKSPASTLRSIIPRRSASCATTPTTRPGPIRNIRKRR